MNEQRLLETATLLYFVSLHEEANKHFDMLTYRDDLEASICQTGACAMGYATEMYREEELYLGRQSTWDNLVLRYAGLSGVDAVAMFYNIAKEEAEHLFGPYTRTAKEEADLICKFVEHKSGNESES